MLRKFGFKKSEPRESEARLKLQKELFKYNQCADHGFPNKPTALAYDARLQLLALGTKHGSIKLYGQPGVEIQGEHPDDVTVSHLYLLSQQARLLSLCSDNSVHLWEVNQKGESSCSLDHVKSFTLEMSKLKTVSSSCLSRDQSTLYLGTEGGNIHVLDVNTCTLKDQVIYQDVVMQNIPDDFKQNPGAVECIEQHPLNDDQLLIGYNKGLIVLWDKKENVSECSFNNSNTTQQLESLSWSSNGKTFYSSHADGSYLTWELNNPTKFKEATTPYGPFPCKAINKLQCFTAKEGGFVVFSGGMPRASYGDRHTISVIQGEKHVVYDFTSRVIDFTVLTAAADAGDANAAHDEPHSIIALVEEELVMIDLLSDGWKQLRQPYLWSLHSSAIMCCSFVSNVPDQFWNKIRDAGNAQMSSYSDREWPIQGGENNATNLASRDIFLTGHEDGTVRFWDASTSCLQLLYKLNTTVGFDMAMHDTTNAGDEEEWPPFRKAGMFDPYSDDPRFGVQKLQLCALSETLAVAGTAGQCTIYRFESEGREVEMRQVSVNIVSDRDGFVWKGHEALPVCSNDVRVEAGFIPSSVVQLHPPAAVTAVALHTQWQLLAIGTAHGVALYDYAQKCEVTTKCTLNPSDLTGTGDSAMSRRKSFKKSLRESFRRLRKRRSERRKRGGEDKADAKSKKKGHSSEGTSGGAASPDATSPTEPQPGSGSATSPTSQSSAAGGAESDVRSVERCVESRAVQDDGLTSMVRTIYFADTFLINAQTHGPIMCVGTHAGTVFMFQISLPGDDQRETDRVTCQLAKEIHLKHRAPVLSVAVIDRTCTPLPGPLEVAHQRSKEPDMTANHQIIICSEEQLKVFALPSLSARNKYKLTANEGSKIRKVAYVNFFSKRDEKYSEYDISLLTNQGDLHIYSIPNLRRQYKAECIRKENILGISTCVLTDKGQAFYQLSSSEFSQVSLSTTLLNKPECTVTPVDGARPPPPASTQEEGEGAKGGDGEDGAKEGGEVKAEVAATEQAASPAPKSPDNGGEQQEEEKPGSPSANDSIATGDMTIDSVKVHLDSSESSFTKSEVVKTSMTRTVVSKTVTSGIAEDGSTTVVRSETTTVQKAGEDAPETKTITTTTTTEEEQDGTKAITHTTVESTDDIVDLCNQESKGASECANEEQLEVLMIREEGDDSVAMTDECKQHEAAALLPSPLPPQEEEEVAGPPLQLQLSPEQEEELPPPPPPPEQIEQPAVQLELQAEPQREPEPIAQEPEMPPAPPVEEPQQPLVSVDLSASTPPSRPLDILALEAEETYEEREIDVGNLEIGVHNDIGAVHHEMEQDVVARQDAPPDAPVMVDGHEPGGDESIVMTFEQQQQLQYQSEQQQQQSVTNEQQSSTVAVDGQQAQPSGGDESMVLYNDVSVLDDQQHVADHDQSDVIVQHQMSFEQSEQSTTTTAASAEQNNEVAATEQLPELATIEQSEPVQQEAEQATAAEQVAVVEQATDTSEAQEQQDTHVVCSADPEQSPFISSLRSHVVHFDKVPVTPPQPAADPDLSPCISSLRSHVVEYSDMSNDTTSSKDTEKEGSEAAKQCAEQGEEVGVASCAD